MTRSFPNPIFAPCESPRDALIRLIPRSDMCLPTDVKDPTENKKAHAKMTSSSMTAGKLYTECTKPTQTPYTAPWFSLADCVWRYFLTLVGTAPLRGSSSVALVTLTRVCSRTQILFYWCLITSPVSFAYYTYKHSMTW